MNMPDSVKKALLKRIVELNTHINTWKAEEVESGRDMEWAYICEEKELSEIYKYMLDNGELF